MPAPDPIDVAIGMLIRRRPNGLSFSQKALAAQLGVAYQQVQRYERGDARFTVAGLEGVAEALKCRLSDLIEARGQPSEPAALDG